MRIFFVCFFLLASVYASGQVISATQAERTTFTTIFHQAKDLKPDPNVLGLEILGRYAMSPERFGEIVRLRARGEDLVVSAAEDEILEKIKADFDEEEERQVRAVDALCATEGMTAERYREILEQYRTDIEFQRSMAPYFEAYRKGRK